MLTVIDLEVELEGLEVYPMHLLNDGHDLGFNKLKHLCTKPICNFFFWRRKGPHKICICFISVSLIATHPVCVGVGVFLIIQLFLFLLGRLGVCVCLKLFQTFS